MKWLEVGEFGEMGLSSRDLLMEAAPRSGEGLRGKAEVEAKAKAEFVEGAAVESGR